MKTNYFILLATLFMLASCGVGTYNPYAQNNFGAQTKVEINQANFRVVRDVEAIVSVNNTNLSRSSVEKSAYGQLLRNAKLTGSQVLINVVIEEIRRESGGFFRWLLGFPKRVQYVAARATIIEFLDENGNPRVSIPYNSTQLENKQPIVHNVQLNNSSAQYDESSNLNSQITDVVVDLSYVQKKDQQIKKLSKYKYIGKIYDIYDSLYKSLSTEEKNISTLFKIQMVVVECFNSNGKSYPNLNKQLTESATMQDQIDIFLSYYKE